MEKISKYPEIQALLESIPEGPPWTADDPDPLIRLAVRYGFTTGRRTTSVSSTSDMPTPKTMDGESLA